MLFLSLEDGQGLVEYAFILVLVAIIVIAVLLLLGPQIGNVFSQVIAGLQGSKRVKCPEASSPASFQFGGKEPSAWCLRGTDRACRYYNRFVDRCRLCNQSAWLGYNDLIKDKQQLG